MPDKRHQWIPSPEDWDRLFAGTNQWHATGSVPAHLLHGSGPDGGRCLARLLPAALLKDEPRRFHLILGPRRVGKTTVLRQTVQSLIGKGIKPQRIWWLQLDRPDFAAITLEALVDRVIKVSKATAELPAFLFLDEIGFSPDWERWLKVVYDAGAPIRIAATSSSASALHKGKHHALTGRCDEHYMLPCTLHEYLVLRGHADYAPMRAGPTLRATIEAAVADRWMPPPQAEAHRVRLMLCGGFPELLAGREGDIATAADEAADLAGKRLRDDSVQRAIYHDIPQSDPLDRPRNLERMFNVLAAATGEQMQPTSICGELGIAVPTFERWLTHLEHALLAFTLTGFGGGEAAVQRRGRKFYLTDAAVRGAVLWRGAVSEPPTVMGHLIETQAGGHLLAAAGMPTPRLHYWREEKSEVDFVYDNPAGPMAFELATSSGHARKGLQAFLRRHKRFAGGCFLVSTEPHVTAPADSGDGIGHLPLNLLLLACGAQVEGRGAGLDWRERMVDAAVPVVKLGPQEYRFVGMGEMIPVLEPDAGTKENRKELDTAFEEGQTAFEDGRYTDAVRAYERARRLDPKSVGVLNNLAVALWKLGRLSEAEATHRETLETLRKALPAGHPDIAMSLNNLAVVLSEQGKLADAETMLREALGTRRKVQPAGDPDIATSLENLASVLKGQGKPADAEAMCREALEIKRKALPAGHPDIGRSLGQLAILLEAQGRLLEAEGIYREALEMRRNAMRAGHPDIAISLHNFATLLDQRLGKHAEAEPMLREALEIEENALGAEHTSTKQTREALGQCLAAQGKRASQ